MKLLTQQPPVLILTQQTPGIDDRGIVILCVSTKMEPAISKDLIQGTANPLNSAFRLTYHMVRL